MTVTQTYSIYVACLAAYNNGKLHGVWVDIDEGTTLDDVIEEVQTMLRNSPEEGAEEWEIHDTDWYGGHSPTTIEEAVEYVEKLSESYLDDDAFASFVSLWGVDDAGHADEAYAGKWDSDEAFAENYVDEMGYLNQIPEHLHYYFDYEKYAADLMINDYSEHNGYYFSKN